MQKFLIIDDYTAVAVWDSFQSEVIPTLKSLPKSFPSDRGINLPRGDWEVCYGMHQLATDSAYTEFGVQKPSFAQLPTIFSVNQNGEVEKQHRVTTDQIRDFISTRI